MALQEFNPKPKSGTGLLVLMPTRGQVSVETHTALSSNCDGLSRAFLSVARRPVVEARNGLWKMASEVSPNLPWADIYCLWCDDDAWWPPGTVAKMVDTLKQYPQIGLLSGSFSNRMPFSSIMTNRIAGIHSPPKPGVDCQLGEIVEVAECGFHFVMHRLSMLEALGPNPFEPFEGVSEDLSFCRRVREAGLRIFCATGALIAHIDPSDGVAYVPGDAAMRVENNELRRTTGSHVVVKTMDERENSKG